MKPVKFLRLLLALPLFAAIASAQIIDTVVFGDPVSESAHAVNAPLTQVITGGLGQPARRMQWDPADTTHYEGGYVHFTANVDPLKVNYVTLKLWGSDTSLTASGILLLYQVENGELLQVGYRVQQVSEYAPLAWATRPEKAIPERFYYTTIPLPLSLTQGRTSVELRVVGAGLNANGSLPVYRAYVHLSAYFEPAASDPQGAQPAAAPIRPPASLSLQAALARARAATIANMTSWLANNNGDLNQLIDGYAVSWTPAYQNSLVPPRVVASVDASCRAYFADPGSAWAEWGGAYGEVGARIAKIGAAGFGAAALDQVVDLGDPAGPAARRVLWAKMLKGSLDVGRFGRRGPTTNQTIINDKALYDAQLGLVALGSSHALPAADATRYLLEAVGLEPWLGPDLVAGGRNSYMGANYFLVSPSGLTKENGYVSAYGEIYDVSADYYTMTGDVRFKTRAVEMHNARGHFRYPMVDAEGYRSFRMVGPLDWRSHQTFPYDQAYGERFSRLSVAAITRDPTALGYARQMFADNQGGSFGTDLASALLLEVLVDEPDSGARLPMTEGEPDYAWADVDNGIVAIKRGEELTWIEPYWQSRTGLHSIGRTFQITPTTARLATVRSDLQFTWNGVWGAKADGPDWSGVPLSTANGLVHQAYFGDKLLHATAPAGAQATREEFIGRASFYATRYGRYLVGINMDQTKSFVLKTPAGFTSAVDLITKRTLAGTITVPPVTAIVLDLGVTTEASPPPHTPKYLEPSGVPGGISVLWETSGGATSYTLKRATARDGPYTVLASGLGATYPKKWGFWPSGAYLDTTAAAGTTYYYKVSAVNAAGESYDSPASLGATPGTAVASVNALPAPWNNVNFSGAGSATIASGAFTLTGGGGDFWGTADGGHFVYQPLTGDGTFVARLTQPGGAYKTGLMIRSSLAPNSPHALLMCQGTSISALRRNSVGGSTAYFGSAVTAAGQVWLKLQRSGKIATFSWAPDAAGSPGAWNVFATATPELGSTAFVGLATTSGSPVFDNVTLERVHPLTAAAPDAPANVVAKAGSGNVTLTWTPANRAAAYSVKRATTSGGPYATVLTTNLAALTFTNAGLTNGTTYHYVVTATHATGESAPSTQVSGTPSAVPGTPSVVVTGTQAVLNWGAAAGATSYTVRRSLDGIAWTTLASNVATTTYTDPGLAGGQSYLYSIVAAHASGGSAPSASSPGTTSPLAPRLLTADGAGTVVRLKWTPVTGATSYRVKRSTTSGGAATTVGSNLAYPSFTDSGLTTNADYFYVVTAVNAAGESVASTELKAGWGLGLLAQYFNNTASTGNPVRVAIDPAPLNGNWGQGSPDPVVNTDNFSVVWTGRLEAPTTETYTFTITGLDDGVRLWINGAAVIDSPTNVRTGTFAFAAGQKYEVRAQFWDGTGAGFVSVTWASPTRAAEALPVSRLYPASLLTNRATGGTATATSQGATETAARAFDGSAGTKWNNGIASPTGTLQYQFASGVTWPVSEYRLVSAADVPQRDPRDWHLEGSNDNVTWTSLDTQTAQTFATRGLSKSYPITNTTAYAYHRLRVTANAGGTSYNLQLAELGLYSPEALPAAPAGLTAAPGNNQVALNWSAVVGATKYQVKRSSHGGGPYTALTEVASGTGYTDTAVTNGATYHYVVATTSALGTGADSAPVTALVAPTPAAPSGLGATSGNGRITLQWATSAWASSYTVKRSTTSGSGYATLASGISLATYADTTVTPATTYYYVVTATNGSGTSGNSAQASALAWTPAVASASANTSSVNERASSAFDGLTHTKWYEGTLGAGGWLQYQFENGVAKTIASYAITSANDVPQRDPKDWQLQGFNGSTWVTLDTRSAETFTSRGQTKLYTIAAPAASASYRLFVTANNGGATYGVQLAELALIPTLPSPWATADIGSTGVAGAAGGNGGVFTAVGSGADIGGLADAFRYVYQTATGDCSITARVVAVQNTNALAKAGVMIRESLNANAVAVTGDITPNASHEALARGVTAGTTGNITVGGAAAPFWVRVVRTGDTFTTSRSPDGSTWTVTSTQTVAMSTNVYIGLVDCSRANTALALAGFDHVTVNP